MSQIILLYVTSVLFMLVILAIIATRVFSTIKQQNRRWYFFAFLLMTACYIIMDGVFVAYSYNPGRKVAMFDVITWLFYLFYILVPFSWHLFIRNFVGKTLPKFVKIMEIIPFAFLFTLIILNPFTHILWGYDAECTYIRGDFFNAFSIVNFFYYADPIIVMLITLLRKKRKEEPYLFQAVLISLPPLIALFVNYRITIYMLVQITPYISVAAALFTYFFIAATESRKAQEKQALVVQNALVEAEKAKEKAIEASNVKTTFLSNMSHDIRTPMNAIMNLISLSKEETDINKIKEYLDKMQISSDFLLGLINDILDMSRIESGQFELHKSALTRTEFLKTVNTVISPLTENKKINFHQELNPGSYTILVDKLRFNQIFFNLLTNAVKFTPDGGDVWFEVNNKEVENNKLHIEFIVKDNGIGMSKKFQEHLFEPFAREHSSLSSKVQGTGLGLSIVKKLVEAMDGTIVCNSILGEGSEFIVNLNVDIISRNELDLNNNNNNNNNGNTDVLGLNILLAEDNEINQYVAQIMLEKMGCKVTIADNGEKAIEVFKANKPHTFDIILMDIRMPILDGMKATQMIRNLDLEDATTIPIIAITADAFDDERQKILECGMTDYLSKPLDTTKLHDMLAKHSSKKTN